MLIDWLRECTWYVDALDTWACRVRRRAERVNILIIGWIHRWIFLLPMFEHSRFSPVVCESPTGALICSLARTSVAFTHCCIDSVRDVAPFSKLPLYLVESDGRLIEVE
uniref:Aminotransferase-like plant mobile domain-containing protein n=1 Tax=Setaria digitata TaxID=48799 RepID=A0A915PL40_9BILA